MKHTWIPLVAALFLALPALAASDFCMDCVQKAEPHGEDDVKITATCCTAQNNHCFPVTS